MTLKAFNLAILLGWLLVTIGGCLLNIGAGLVAGGLLLLAITFAVARMAGIYATQAEKDGE